MILLALAALLLGMLGMGLVLFHALARRIGPDPAAVPSGPSLLLTGLLPGLALLTILVTLLSLLHLVWAWTIAPLALLAGAFGYTISKAKELSFWQMLPIALIFSGGVGNIIDRLLYNRHVTDFMNINIPFLKKGIFNFADVCITAGALCLLVYLKKKPEQVQVG